MRLPCFRLLASLLFSPLLHAAPACDGTWQLQLTSANWGDIHARFEMRAETPELCVGRHAGSEGMLRLKLVGGNILAGELQFAQNPPQPLQIDSQTGRGEIQAGSMRGPLAVTFSSPPGALRPYPQLAAHMLDTATRQVYRPAALQHPSWQHYAAQVARVAENAQDDLAFLLGLARQWDGKAFSHFRFWRPNQSTPALMDSLARLLPPGAQAVELKPLGHGVALLSLRHFIGTSVRQQIATAFEQLPGLKTQQLILDLRGNQGGEFGGLDVAAQLGGAEALMGVFIGPRWWNQHSELPDTPARAQAADLQDRSLMGFQAAIRDQALTALRHRPVAQPFTGAVWVLTDARTASAAELLAAWLGDSGRAQLVGERTRGAVLASVFLDLPDGFKLMVPSADYVTAAGQRLEGQGVQPHVAVPGEQALDRALQLAAQPRS
ncbi:S41 family peptidase [Inhella gelatinilytica]|uniref:Tail specific protease domain-containing protein n=1 Tax=Inhella gelatinilytica TaxID=2795030 RepID=A0A931NCG4_9BURK|nr:S41 family peptidase [Inhella gelatinilytica]MBH9551539.1 hypothetical protein [Inhella gelatinilytica]